MATKYWRGIADAVAQIATATLTAYDAATTYKVTIGDVTVSVVGSGGTTAATATALIAALEASTHPYFTAINWDSGGASIVRGTAAVAGAAFVFSTSVTGGTGTIGAYTVTTANAGPNDWSTANNWSDQLVPGASDTVFLKENEVNICHGLAQAVSLTKLIAFQSYTGKVGLDYAEFATSADGGTTEPSVPEYRTKYLTFTGVLTTEIGKNIGPVLGAGSPRFMLDAGNTANSTITVFNTANTSSESTRPCVRLKGNVATMTINIRSGIGGVGIANEIPGETSLVSKISVADSGKIFVGEGTTLTTYEQQGGIGLLQAAADITNVYCFGGTLTIEGDFTITNLICMTGGYIYCNNIKTAGSPVTKGFSNGGTVDYTGSTTPRTIAQHYCQPGGTLISNGKYVTITVLNTGDCSDADYNGLWTLKVTAGA